MAEINDLAIAALVQRGEEILAEKRQQEEERERAREQKLREKQQALEKEVRDFIPAEVRPYVTEVTDDGSYGIYAIVQIPDFAPVKIRMTRLASGELDCSANGWGAYKVPAIAYGPEWDWEYNSKSYRDLALALVAARDQGAKFSGIQEEQREVERQYHETEEAVKTAEYVPIDESGELLWRELMKELVTLIRDVVREELNS